MLRTIVTLATLSLAYAIPRATCSDIRETFTDRSCCASQPFNENYDQAKGLCPCGLAEPQDPSVYTDFWILFHYKNITATDIENYDTWFTSKERLIKERFSGLVSSYSKDKTEMVSLGRFPWSSITRTDFVDFLIGLASPVTGKLSYTINILPQGLKDDPAYKVLASIVESLPTPTSSYEITNFASSHTGFSNDASVNIILGEDTNSASKVGEFNRLWTQKYLAATVYLTAYDSENNNEIQISFSPKSTGMGETERSYRSSLLAEVFAAYPDYLRPNSWQSFAINIDDRIVDPALAAFEGTQYNIFEFNKHVSYML